MITLFEVKELISRNKKYIDSVLPKPQQQELVNLQTEIEKKIAKRKDLDKITENDQLPIREINATYESIKLLEDQITALFMKMQKAIGATDDDITKDEALRKASHLTRQGVVNIRPVGNIKFDSSELRIPKYSVK